ncbi:hypothetical protein ABGB18_46190 [Nonomuraea sp. B12E4]|uniref:hypothetical protein n=1 Tax=Nonomuraea sp. B12E4 TaxID=3153564 RepID=UPI00325D4DFA
MDDTTANGDCVVHNLNSKIPEGLRVMFKICTYHASTKKYYSCKQSREGRA